MGVIQQLLRFPTALFIAALGVLLYLPGIGEFHLFDWDEINFAECAREMLLTKNYLHPQINFTDFYEKPPLFIWMQALSMHQFGIHAWGARFPNVIAGVFTLLLVYRVGKLYADQTLGVLWALFFAASFLPQFYFKSGIIDPWFNWLIAASLFSFFDLALPTDFEDRRKSSRRKWSTLLLSGVLAGLAILTKGPVALLILLGVFAGVMISNKGKNFPGISFVFLWLVIALLVAGSWFGQDYLNGNGQFMQSFIDYQIRLFTTRDAGHGGPWYYHLVVVFLGCFPASALMFAGMFKNSADDTGVHQLRRWMLILLIVVLGVFSITQTKIIHYSSLAWFPVTFFAALFVHRFLNRHANWNWKQNLPLLAVGIAWSIAAIGIVILGKEIPEIASYIRDPFAAEAVSAKVFWNTAEMAYGLFFLLMLFSSVLILKAGFPKTGLSILLLGGMLFGQLLYRQLAFRIERYSQGAYIDFLLSHASEDCNIETAEFKSYAHLFYGNRPPRASQDLLQRDYVLHQPVPFTVYVVTKAGKEQNTLGYYPSLKELYRKNGWVFYQKISDPAFPK